MNVSQPLTRVHQVTLCMLLLIPSTYSAIAQAVVIDGINDFAVVETYSTTTTGHNAYLAIDGTDLNLGYSGAALANYSSTEWAIFFIDVNSATGSSAGETLGSQTQFMPVGMNADYIFRYKLDGSYSDIRSFDGTNWGASGLSSTTGRTTDFFEASISLADLGLDSSIRISSVLINEALGQEWTFGGLGAGSFTDGYHINLPLSEFVEFNLAAVPETGTSVLLGLVLLMLSLTFTNRNVSNTK